MRNPADIIVEIKSDNSRLFKESVLIREMNANNSFLFEGIKFALDKLVTFGVKIVPEKTDNDKITSLYHEEFISLLNMLYKRELTGHAARNAIVDCMNKCSIHDWNNWYRLILMKDLKCGVSETTINNCAKKSKKTQFNVPVFACQLAQDSKNHQSKLTGKKIVDVKMDGTRFISIVYPDGRVEHFTRNGKIVTNFPHIQDQFKIVSKYINEPMVFDGEMMSSSFQDLMSNFFRKENVNTQDSILYLFDMIPLKDFSNGFYNTKQINRLESLHTLIDNIESLDNIKTLSYEIIDFDDSLDIQKYNQINKNAIENGYEGIMIKDIYAPYETKRTFSWLKLKPVLTFDLIVNDLEEGTGKNIGKLGAIICSGIEEGKEIFVNVGSGFSDEQRDLYWINKDELKGLVIEVEADAITQNQDGCYSLRFPRFKRIRGFDKGEKL